MEAQSRQSIAEYAEEAGTKGLVIIAESGLGSRPPDQALAATRARSASAARPGAAGASAFRTWVAGRPAVTGRV